MTETPAQTTAATVAPMSRVSEFDAETRRARSFDLMAGLWRYMGAFEQADTRVVELARDDLEELHGRIDRLLRKNAKAA